MTETKKIQKIIDIVVILACVFPLIIYVAITLATYGNYEGFIEYVSPTNIIEKFTISDTMYDYFMGAFDLLEISGNATGPLCTMCSNTLIIYISYVFVEALIFIPKLCIKFMRRF